jgi:hypothetical protein
VANSAIHNPGERLAIFALAGTVLITVVCAAFAMGWLIGRILL